jgi:hypothetical protein
VAWRDKHRQRQNLLDEPEKQRGGAPQ